MRKSHTEDTERTENAENCKFRIENVGGWNPL